MGQGVRLNSLNDQPAPLPRIIIYVKTLYSPSLRYKMQGDRLSSDLQLLSVRRWGNFVMFCQRFLGCSRACFKAAKRAASLSACDEHDSTTVRIWQPMSGYLDGELQMRLCNTH